jgi:tetratricopeptide (TPR) repeat protein
MRDLSAEEIRHCFSRSTDFNEIFDAFQSALQQDLRDLELYQLLFWNPSLSADELRLFGEKLAEVFPDLSFDVFLWLAKVFEVTHASKDNYELALHYYHRAAHARPSRTEPYVNASNCYDADLNIPPLPILIEFVRAGILHVADPAPLYARLAELYDIAGDVIQSEECRRKAGQRLATDENPPGEA